MSSSPFPTTRPANWKSLAPPPRPGPAFAGQAALPRLPVPALADTTLKLKESLQPIAWSAQELEDAARAVDAFAASDFARELQDRLVKRSEEPGRLHWLEEWWDDLAYMGYRDSVVINVSYYYGFDDHPTHFPQTAVHRAASIVRAAMMFREQFKLGQVAPEATKEGPICMDTWRWMFDCCRVPGAELDWAVSHAKAGDNGRSGYVVVLHKGRVWKLEPWQSGELLSLDELQRQIEHIYENTTHEYPGVGVLTASNRDVWHKDFQALAADPHNAHILTTIHAAAFVLCLDTESASGLADVSRVLWHGAVTPPSAPGGLSTLGLRNRWMDKPCQFVVLADGTAGFVGEHSVMDGTPTATMCDRVCDIIAAPSFAAPAPSPTSPTSPSSPAALPLALDWHTTPTTDAAIARATEAAAALIATQELRVVRTAYGKAAIKTFAASPDGWAQMVIHLAYARLVRSHPTAMGQPPSSAGEGKRVGGTYEAASTRRFARGRTEAIRVASVQADAWAASMDDGDVSPARRVALLRDALKKHGADARAAGAGQGVDRHILGLKLSLRAGEALPPVFSHPLVQRASHWALSTSAIYAKHFGPYGWGEVVPDGFGVAYTAGFDHHLQFTVTSRVGMPNAAFCAELERAAADMYDLFAGLAKAKL